MSFSRDEVMAAVRASFPEDRWSHVAQALDTYGAESYELERERVQLAILKLSMGNEDKLREHVAVAKTDYRDILLWADEPEASKLDTPEKKKEVRDMLKRFGIEPPPGLDD
ncbi:MAG: hypothetical protein HY924_08240 [Elusimicrobia bacterium]|nr:hypothetical protein [Elusimicrobiota bacterium]